MSQPSGIAVDEQTDIIFVADTGNNRMLEFHMGDLVVVWNKDSNGKLLNNPTAVALDGTGAIYVADTNNNRVLVYEYHGIELLEIDGRAGSNGDFTQPQGLSSDGVNLYVSDTVNNRIMKFVPCGQATPIPTLCEKFVWAIGNMDEHIRLTPTGGSGGSGPPAFNAPVAPSVLQGLAMGPKGGKTTFGLRASSHSPVLSLSQSSEIHEARLNGVSIPAGAIDPPQGAAVGPDGLVWVTEDTAADVVQFDPRGFFVRYILMPDGSNPQGVAVRADGTGAVVLHYYDSIQIVQNNQASFSIGFYGSSPGRFINPEGVAFDANGNLYVADTGNNRIQVFSSSLGSNPTLVFGSSGIGPQQFNAPTGWRWTRTGISSWRIGQ